MKNPVNRLATAAPRALDSLLGGGTSKSTTSKDTHDKKKQRERTCSFDLDLSGLNLDSSSGSISGGSSVGLSASSIAEEGSVVTFEDLSSEFANEISKEWNANMEGSSNGAPSPN